MSNRVYVVVDYVGFYILAVTSNKDTAEEIKKKYKDTKNRDALIKEMELV